jgi:hypothetical protein
MKTNVSIDLSEEERDLLANLIDKKTTKRLATRGDIVKLVNYIVERVLDNDDKSGKAEIANGVIADINRGAWSFIDE